MDVLIIDLSVSQVISSQVKKFNQHQMAVPSKSEQLLSMVTANYNNIRICTNNLWRNSSSRYSKISIERISRGRSSFFALLASGASTRQRPSSFTLCSPDWVQHILVELSSLYNLPDQFSIQEEVPFGCMNLELRTTNFSIDAELSTLRWLWLNYQP